MTIVPISIAMATYNGGPFLKEQLDSLAKQTLKPQELVVCDDGSSDDTIAILEDFAALAPFPVIIHRNETRLGHTENFFKAANLCSAKWIGFCDQDDIWLPNKLEVVARQIAAAPSLLMVIHSATCTDRNLKPLNLRSPDFRSDVIVTPPTMLRDWAGFASVFSSDLLRIGNMLRRPINHWDGKDPVWHDRWVYLLANAFGEIACLSQSLALYRRHDHSVTGMPKQRKAFELSAGTLVHADVRLKEQHYLESSKILTETPLEAGPLRQSASSAALFYARVADIHRRRRELYETPDKAFSLLAQSFLKGDFGKVTKGGFRIRDLFFDVYRLYLLKRRERLPAAPARATNFTDKKIAR